MAASQAKSGGNKKIGRDLDKCKRYRIAQRRYKNKIRRLRKRYGKSPKLDVILAVVPIHRKGYKHT